MILSIGIENIKNCLKMYLGLNSLIKIIVHVSEMTARQRSELNQDLETFVSNFVQFKITVQNELSSCDC